MMTIIYNNIKHRFITILTLACIVAISITNLYACKEPPKFQKEVFDNYTQYTNAQYGEDAERQILDLCIPNNKTGRVGLILMIHGGGWTAGNKDGYLSSLVDWASNKGYVSAAINYRYASSSVHYADIIDDISSSLVKIKEISAEHNILLEKMLLTGGSAGGHLSLLYGYSQKDTAPITPAAIVSLCGPTDLTDINYYNNTKYQKELLKMINPLVGKQITINNYTQHTETLLNASPISYITATSIPTVICHGQLDDLVPYSNAITLKNKLDEFGVTNHLVPFPNSGHELGYDPDSTARMNELMLEYANLYLN